METNPIAFLPDIDLRLILKKEFNRRMRKNPKYSLRAFAKALGISHSAVSELISGRRRFSTRNVARIGSTLKWSKEKMTTALHALQKDPGSYTSLDSQQAHQLDAWYYNAILELFLIEGFEPAPQWIAHALKLEEVTVVAALAKLIELGFLSVTRNGNLKVRTSKTTTLGNVQSKDSILRVQKQNLEKQIESLAINPVEIQSSMGLTIPMDPIDLPEARKIIFRCMKELDSLLNRKGARRTEVYRLQLGLFPLTDLHRSTLPVR